MKKSSGKKLIKNLIYNSIYQILIIILPLLTSPYVSRVLGSEGLGIYSYTYSVASCFALFGMLGVNNYGNRTIAAVQNNRNKRSAAFWSIWFLQVIMTSLTCVVYIIYLYKSSEVYKLVSYIQIITILSSMTDINWFFFGMEKFKITVTRNIIIRLINVCCIFLFVKSEQDIWKYSLILVGGHFLSTAALWPFLRLEVDFIKPKIREVFSHFGQMSILFIPVIAITLYKKMDKVMLGALSTMSQTGFYENTEKVINIPLGLITAIGTVMLPRMTNLFSNGINAKAKKYMSISMEFACFLSIGMAFGIAGISNEFAPFFFGEEFMAVGKLIKAIAPTIVFMSWANVIRTQYLIPLHQDKIYILSVWFGAIINLIINYILIPKLGALGAVYGTVCAEGSVMLYQTWCTRKALPIKSYLKKSIFYFIPGIVMYFVIRLIASFREPNFITIVIEVLVGMIVYIVLCIPYILVQYKKEIRTALRQ